MRNPTPEVEDKPVLAFPGVDDGTSDLPLWPRLPE